MASTVTEYSKLDVWIGAPSYLLALFVLYFQWGENKSNMNFLDVLTPDLFPGFCLYFVLEVVALWFYF